MYAVLMAETPQDPQTLEDAAKEYYLARHGEFSLNDLETDTIIDAGKKRLRQLFAGAVENAAYLMEHADSDAVRWNVTKYILDHITHIGEKSEEDLEAFLKNLYNAKPDTGVKS